jgi:enediyne biosynthesis protein E4
MLNEIKSQFEILLLLILSFTIVVSCTPDSELEWNDEEGYRWAEINTGFFGGTGFEEVRNSRTGVTFRNDVSSETVSKNRHYLNGSGVAVGDINGNGFIDIYFASLEGPNKLYKNLGNFRFQDITEEAGISHEGYNSTGVVFADINGNGFLDLLVSSLSEGNTLYINDGEGSFSKKENSGLAESRGAHTITLGDINGNGYLDLYIANYKVQTARDRYNMEELSLENTVSMQNGDMVILPPFNEDFTIIETSEGQFRNEKGEADELYLNQGDGTFRKADDRKYFFDENGNSRGLTPDWGLTAKFIDVTGNRLPDLYVANDFWTPDRFWINQGDGTFRLAGPDAIQNMSFSSMGVDFSDINRNGYLDFVVTEMLSMDHSMRLRQSSEYLPEFEGRTMHSRNSVYKNRGDTTFAQIAYYSGLEASEWSWATYFLDINLNGYEDLIVATGFGRDYQDIDTQISMYEQDIGLTRGDGNIINYPILKLPNKIFKNNSDLTFTDMSEKWGFDSEDISLGVALADLNNDGNMEVIINRFNEEAAIYKNKTNAPRIGIRLKGESPNTQGIGARIELKGGSVLQSKEITSGGNYLSGSQAQVVFAADKNTSHTIRVRWPDGREQIINNVAYNRIYEIDQSHSNSADDMDVSKDNHAKETLFEDVSDVLGHVHHENEYDDFRFSPLLPLRLSTLGPGMAWLDVNGNGYDDLLITSGKDGNLALYENQGDGLLNSIVMAPLTNQAPGDQTSIIGWREDGKVRVVVGSANYEQGNPNVPSAFIYSIEENGNIETEMVPGILSTTGPVVAADYTGNGYLDLFVGGRHKPGQYPVDADSRFFRNENGTFVYDEQNSGILSGAGLVTDAQFADFTGNGRQDLLISTEWGTLRLFENRSGNFQEITRTSGLHDYKGWWKGIATGDFTNNGLPDIIALNIGLNSAYQLREGNPLRIYYEDFNWDGRLNILESYYCEDLGAWVPRRKLHDFESVPTILRNISTHREYASSSIEKIFDQNFDNVPYKEINTLKHMIFVNTGEGFEPQALPDEAQFSSAFFAGVADFDNDGNEDLFISQNFYGFPDITPRLDAGRGLILMGDGKGNFDSMKSAESGIQIYGEQRAGALADMNQNGRVDVAVSQNNGKTRLFLNKTENPGVQVRLEGPESNKLAFGSSLQLLYEGGTKGPRRFLQAGSGYLSQNSSLQVLGKKEKPIALKIVWFNGKEEIIKMSSNEDALFARYSD